MKKLWLGITDSKNMWNKQMKRLLIYFNCWIYSGWSYSDSFDSCQCFGSNGECVAICMTNSRVRHEKSGQRIVNVSCPAGKAALWCGILLLYNVDHMQLTVFIKNIQECQCSYFIDIFECFVKWGNWFDTKCKPSRYKFFC